MSHEAFARKIVAELAAKHIAFVDSHRLRPFDPARDRVHVTLTGRQWEFVRRLCRRDYVFNKFIMEEPIDGYHYWFRYNERMSVWEGYGTDTDRYSTEENL